MLDATWSGFDTNIGVLGVGLATLLPEELSGGEKVEMDVTTILQDVVAGTKPNRGLALKSSDERFDLDFARFFSHSYPDTDLVPILRVEYVLPPELPTEILDPEGE